MPTKRPKTSTSAPKKATSDTFRTSLGAAKSSKTTKASEATRAIKATRSMASPKSAAMVPATASSASSIPSMVDLVGRSPSMRQTPWSGAALVQLKQLTHNHPMARFAAKYLATEVYGVQAQNTFEAKSRDLTAFITWFVAANGHAEISDWMPRDTKAYLVHLEGQDRAPTTVNRALATIKHFAKWIHELPGGRFAAHGLPTRGVKELAVDEPTCKKLSRVEIHRLFKAADAMVLTDTRVTQRPRRNRAILTVLYHTGLRVSELVCLDRKQYTGKHLVNVKRKGNNRTKSIYLSQSARVWIDDYIQHERPIDAKVKASTALFLVDRTGQTMTRQRVWDALRKLGEEAGKHQGQPIDVHPHRLRHTFAAHYRNKTGSDSETARTLGHTSLQYVGRYARRSDQERENTIDEIFPS